MKYLCCYLLNDEKSKGRPCFGNISYRKQFLELQESKTDFTIVISKKENAQKVFSEFIFDYRKEDHSKYYNFIEFDELQTCINLINAEINLNAEVIELEDRFHVKINMTEFKDLTKFKLYYHLVRLCYELQEGQKYAINLKALELYNLFNQKYKDVSFIALVLLVECFSKPYEQYHSHFLNPWYKEYSQNNYYPGKLKFYYQNNIINFLKKNDKDNLEEIFDKLKIKNTVDVIDYFSENSDVKDYKKDSSRYAKNYKFLGEYLNETKLIEDYEKNLCAR